MNTEQIVELSSLIHRLFYLLPALLHSYSKRRQILPKDKDILQVFFVAAHLTQRSVLPGYGFVPGRNRVARRGGVVLIVLAELFSQLFQVFLPLGLHLLDFLLEHQLLGIHYLAGSLSFQRSILGSGWGCRSVPTGLLPLTKPGILPIL